jgi:hypothetical protein
VLVVGVGTVTGPDGIGVVVVGVVCVGAGVIVGRADAPPEPPEGGDAALAADVAASISTTAATPKSLMRIGSI